MVMNCFGHMVVLISCNVVCVYVVVVVVVVVV